MTRQGWLGGSDGDGGTAALPPTADGRGRWLVCAAASQPPIGGKPVVAGGGGQRHPLRLAPVWGDDLGLLPRYEVARGSNLGFDGGGGLLLRRRRSAGCWGGGS
jgi:hypothetical protein